MNLSNNQIIALDIFGLIGDICPVQASAFYSGIGVAFEFFKVFITFRDIKIITKIINGNNVFISAGRTRGRLGETVDTIIQFRGECFPK